MAQAKKPANKPKKTAAESKSASETATIKPRQLKSTPKKPSKFRRKNRPALAKLPGVLSILRGSVVLLWQYKWRFLGVLFIYGVLQVVLVQGVLATHFNEVVDVVKNALETDKPNLEITFALFGYMIVTSGKATSADGTVYQLLLVLMASLALIWTLRQVSAGTKVRIRDAFYKGMHPVIPFILVLGVVLLETVPLLAGVWLYNTVTSEAIAAAVWEKIVWLFAAGVLGFISLYLLTASVIALYITALPDMTPVRALRSAHSLVNYRRLAVFWRIIFLGFVYFVSLAAAVLPVIVISPKAAPFVFYLVTVLLLAVVHSYMYRLYRELLIDDRK